MKKLKFILVGLLFCTVAVGQVVSLTVKNPSSFDRKTEMVEISLADIKSKITLVQGEVYVVKNGDNTVIPSQTTFDGMLIFQSGLGAKQRARFTIYAGENPIFTPATYARLATERLDDLIWENDRVAFRLYGAALIAKDGPSNGIDVLYKRSNKFVLNKWFEQDRKQGLSYHLDHGDGLDDYKVGRSLGGGAMAPFVNEKLVLNSNFVSHSILENGPLRTTFILTYPDLEVDSRVVSESRTISIDAGSQLSKIVQEYGFVESTTVAAGFAKRESGDSVVANKNYIIYCEPATERSSGVYLGLIFPQGYQRVVTNRYEVEQKQNTQLQYTHTLAVAKYTPSKPFVYYTGYGWSKFGFEQEKDFQKYVEQFSQSLTQPFVVSYK